MDDQQRGMALIAAGYGFGGAGLVAPKLVASVFGLSDASDEYLALMRLLAIRNVALAEAFRAVSDDDKRRKHFFTVAAAMIAAGVVLSQPVVSTTPSSG